MSKLLNEALKDKDFQREFLTGVQLEKFLGLVEHEMRRQGKTAKSIAKYMECSVSNVDEILREEHDLSLKTMTLIAKALGFTLDISLDRE